MNSLFAVVFDDRAKADAALGELARAAERAGAHDA